MRCPWCGSGIVTPVVIDPLRFREEREEPRAYICRGCKRIIPAEELVWRTF